MIEHKCKFVSGDGAYKYLYLKTDSRTPPNEYRFSVFKQMRLDLISEITLENCVGPTLREYLLSGREGIVWIYRER